MKPRLLIPFVAAICSLGLAACNPGVSNGPPNLRQRLFVANFASGGNTSSIAIYSYPLTNTSAPSSVLPSAGGPNGASGIAIDAGDNLFVTNASNSTVTAYVPLVGSGSTPTVTISSGISQPQDITFDGPGNLYVANFNGSGTGNIAAYGRPFTNSSTPAFVFTGGVSGPTSVSFDGVGSVYVTNKTAGNVTRYSLPASAASTPNLTLSNGLSTPVATAIDTSGNVYVVNNGNNSVAVFSVVGLTNASTPAFTITNGVSAPRYVIFDSAGQLYVSNAGTITIYQPPFSASSQPVVTISSGLSTPIGLTVGF